MMKDSDSLQELITLLTTRWGIRAALGHFLREDNAVNTQILA